MWALILIPIVILIIIIIIILVVVFSKKNNTGSNYDGHYKELKYSDKVKNYVDTRQKFYSTNLKYVDRNGKSRVRYDDSEKTFTGEKCFLTDDDINFVNEIVDLIFPTGEFDESLRSQKIKHIYNCKESTYGGTSWSKIDVRYFFKNDKYTIFPFHLTSDKRSLQVLYYCQTRSKKFVEMPSTSYSKGNLNFLAYFDNDCFNEMCFLYYIMNRYSAGSGLEIHGFGSGFFGLDLKGYKHDKDFVFEYFYRMMKCRGSEFYPRLDASAETSARMVKLQGYPPPTEWVSALAELTAEMQEKGIIITKYHNYNERQLFFLVKETYSDAIYQYKEEWLGLLSLDIYIPSIKTAIEYQGGQHYKAVKFYGGRDELAKIQARDIRKKQLCSQHGIRLIEWKFDVSITKANLNKFLK